jgi:serine/threonine protein phosphatase PrpC
MASQLSVSVGQHSDKGRKEAQQDFHGIYLPREPQLSSKGIAIAIADGISSSAVSHIASEFSVTSFLEDYYCTSEAWSVKKSAQRVLAATNSWLHTQSQQSPHRYDKDKGYVCTFSALVLKSTTAHIFHTGDTRVYRLRDTTWEQLTRDHRLWVSETENYLSRALGIHPNLEIDYQALAVEEGDIFVLSTDGVYEHVNAQFIIDVIRAAGDDLDNATKSITTQAYGQGSSDNLTLQILRVDTLPYKDANEVYQELTQLPFPPMLEARMVMDGYKIIRQVHASSRSHVYLALDGDTNEQVIIKTPSIDLRGNAAYLERFLMEEWIAKRINSPHVLKPCSQSRKRSCLYIVTEYIDGQTLAQWMIDKPKPDMQTVRDIVAQIAKGLRAFHKLEMLHQDLRPNNIMIDSTGTVKIIDFGSTKVAGILEISSPLDQSNLLGTAQYTAPEYFLGEEGSASSDLFSLGVIAYQMLTGKLPYGAEVAKTKTKTDQKRLEYNSARDNDRSVLVWIDETLRKAVHPNPQLRYQELSEFVFDLSHPNKAFLARTRPPLLERNPVVFWKVVSIILTIVIAVLLHK